MAVPVEAVLAGTANIANFAGVPGNGHREAIAGREAITDHLHAATRGRQEPPRSGFDGSPRCCGMRNALNDVVCENPGVAGGKTE